MQVIQMYRYISVYDFCLFSCPKNNFFKIFLFNLKLIIKSYNPI